MFTSRLTNNRTDISVYISVVKEKSFFFLTSIKYKDRSVTTRIGFKDIENDIDTPFFISRSTFVLSLSLSLWEKINFFPRTISSPRSQIRKDSYQKFRLLGRALLLLLLLFLCFFLLRSSNFLRVFP